MSINTPPTWLLIIIAVATYGSFMALLATRDRARDALRVRKQGTVATDAVRVVQSPITGSVEVRRLPQDQTPGGLQWAAQTLWTTAQQKYGSALRGVSRQVVAQPDGSLQTWLVVTVDVE